MHGFDALTPVEEVLDTAADWNLTAEQVAKLDAASAVTPIYPYWRQRQFTERNPIPV